MEKGKERVPDGSQEQGLSPNTPAPMTVPLNGAGTPIGPREKSTQNDG